ncbi:MAG: hypothetical protein HQL15_10130, partial [Candidatus Omnitrophica bacterium]|nr:hypothetical protein [Candidatus Omnitrophota bacterium]
EVYSFRSKSEQAALEKMIEGLDQKAQEYAAGELDEGAGCNDQGVR